MNKTTPKPGWQVVLSQELRHLWLGWRGPLLLFAFSLFLSGYILLLAIDPEVNVLSHLRMINLAIQASVMIGILAVVLLGANSFSGERDQRSLESLLLTPVPRDHLILGKLLAIQSLWLGMLPIAIPYILLLAKGTDRGLAGVMLLMIPGTLLVFLSATIGVLVSSVSPTNLVSFAAGFVIVLLLAAPTQLPGGVQDLPAINWFIRANPITAVANYQTAVIIDGEAWTAGLGQLLSPIIALALVAGLGPRFLDKRLSLEGGFKA